MKERISVYRIWFMVFFLTMLSAKFAYAIDEFGNSISGRVISKEKQIIVRAVDNMNPKIFIGGKVNTDGTFTIMDIPPGEYHLTFMIARGGKWYFEICRDIDVEEDKSAPISSVDKKEISRIISEIDKAMRSKDINYLMSFYSKSYTNNHGYDFNSIKGLHSDRMKLGDVNRTTEIKLIEGNSQQVGVLIHSEYISNKNIKKFAIAVDHGGDKIMYFHKENGEWKVYKEDFIFPNYKELPIYGGMGFWGAKTVASKELGRIKIQSGQQITNLSHTITVLEE